MPFTDVYPDELILAYVPEAEDMGHTQAMFLAMERDNEAAERLIYDAELPRREQRDVLQQRD